MSDRLLTGGEPPVEEPGRLRPEDVPFRESRLDDRLLHDEREAVERYVRAIVARRLRTLTDAAADADALCARFNALYSEARRRYNSARAFRAAMRAL